MARSPVLALLSIFVFFTVHTANAEMYRWKDKNGNIHFSDKPHADATRLEIKAPKPSGIGVSKSQNKRQQQLLKSFEKRRLKREREQAENRKQREVRERHCSKLKNRLLNYEDADYVFTRDSSGKKIRFSREQKKQEQQKLRDKIAQDC